MHQRQELDSLNSKKKLMHNFKKCNMSISIYIMKIKMLSDKLQATRCEKSKEEKLMTILNILDENFDNAYLTIIEKMLSKHVIIDDVKALLHNNESILERRKVLINSMLLPSANISVKSSASLFLIMDRRCTITIQVLQMQQLSLDGNSQYSPYQPNNNSYIYFPQN